MDKQAKLDALAEEIVKEKVCSRFGRSGNAVVMGDGNPDAIIILAKRGKNEDLQGKSRLLVLRENSLMKIKIY